MRSRRRGIAFAVGALACAGLAAAIVSGYASQAEQRFGDLSEVLIAGEALPPGTVIDAATARRGLAIRRVPLEFVPPDALSSAAEAIGSRPAVLLVAGSYLTAGALRPGPAPSKPERSSPRGSPVEITVSGAGALAAGHSAPVKAVDIVVTGEPGPGGRTAVARIAARGVPLLNLRRGGAEPGISPGESWIATLALDRDEALRIIRAESFARSIRLLAAAAG